MRRGIMNTPALVIDDKIVSTLIIEVSEPK